jgi:hypothetical protein
MKITRTFLNVSVFKVVVTQHFSLSQVPEVLVFVQFAIFTAMTAAWGFSFILNTVGESYYAWRITLYRLNLLTSFIQLGSSTSSPVAGQIWLILVRNELSTGWAGRALHSA